MVTWNAEANTKLFLAIMRQCNVKPDQEKLAVELTQALGEEVTVYAIQNQLKKLKKQVKESAGDEIVAKSSPKTAPKSKTKTQTKDATTKGKGVKHKAQTMLPGDDDDEEDQKPIKKIKSEEEEDGWNS